MTDLIIAFVIVLFIASLWGDIYLGYLEVESANAPGDRKEDR